MIIYVILQNDHLIGQDFIPQLVLLDSKLQYDYTIQITLSIHQLHSLS